MNKLVALVFLITCSRAIASDPYPRNESIDILHYTFQLEVNDSTNTIVGQATVSILFNKPVKDFELDLVNKGTSDGMEVSRVSVDGTSLQFMHQHDRLKIILSSVAKSRDQISVTIQYHGIPRDGLTIGKNKFNDRGFFGDNWPDRAHHWLPVIDHPYDKAGVDFIVTAPSHYAVVANGIKVEESFIDANRKLTHWHEEIDIPTKVMVVGIARFAIQYVGKVDDIPVETWVFPQNKEDGFRDYGVALKVLDYFHHHIGPYPYKKLANVQSKTRWGGLENANTIFYAENAVTGQGKQESLIAHEEAHQWFGNSATERDWYHVWLSEGFATYFSNLYLEYAYGHDRLIQEQKIDRQQIIRFAAKDQTPVVDSTRRELNSILNINTYQKGGWVLHMLRHLVGDQAFWKGIQTYYATYRYGNAMTIDFQHVMEQASGKDLKPFFDQWLYRPGHPKLEAKWGYDANTKAVTVTILQTQKGPAFKMVLDIGITVPDGKEEMTTVNLDKQSQEFSFPAVAKPVSLALDPQTWLLFEGKIEPK